MGVGSRLAVAVFLCFLLTVDFLPAGPAPALGAEGLTRPTGRVILSVSGDIANTNAGDRADFDRDMLEAIGLTELRTSTHWTEGVQTFEGVLARDLLAAVDARGQTAKAIALDDYSVEIPLSDFQAYAVLLALKMNGKYMRVRERGPLWIVYPRDDHKELVGKDVDAKWLWQLRKLEIK